MENNINSGPKLPDMNLISVRRWCVERTIEFIKGEGAFSKSDLGLCGMQDLKCQIVDCAKALSDFILEGKSVESLVGKTPLLLSASRALADRKIALSVRVFNSLMRSKGCMSKAPSSEELTEMGLEFGENRPIQPLLDPSTTKPYYMDNRFDELLTLLGVSFKKRTNIKSTK